MAIGLDSDKNLIVATSSALLAIDAKANTTILDEYGEWRPNISRVSLVIKDDIAYLGLIKGIYKFNLKTKKAEWLLPD